MYSFHSDVKKVVKQKGPSLFDGVNTDAGKCRPNQQEIDLP